MGGDEGGKQSCFSLDELSVKMHSLWMCDNPRHLSEKMKSALMQVPKERGLSKQHALYDYDMSNSNCDYV